MSIKIDILKEFLKNQTLFKSMRDCHHFYNNNINPYHLEGDVWTHTMLVYNQADEMDYIELIMALCHDIGKVFTRKYNEKTGKVTMYGHANASIQPTIDFISTLEKQGILTKEEILHFIGVGLPAMANHMVYYQNLDKADYFSFSRFETIKKEISHYIERMADMDSKGSICKKEIVKGKKTNIVEKPFKHKKHIDGLPSIIIWTGLPGSGKDYLANIYFDNIVSFDNCRIELYKENVSKNKWLNLSDKEIYNNAFKFCNENNVDLNKKLRKKVIQLTNKGENVCICNTSLTRKSRRKLINILGPNKFNFILNQVFAPTDVILKRNTNRSSKTVPIDVINRMMKNMTVATHFEDHFSEIHYVYNN